MYKVPRSEAHPTESFEFQRMQLALFYQAPEKHWKVGPMWTWGRGRGLLLGFSGYYFFFLAGGERGGGGGGEFGFRV